MDMLDVCKQIYYFNYVQMSMPHLKKFNPSFTEPFSTTPFTKGGVAATPPRESIIFVSICPILVLN